MNYLADDDSDDDGLDILRATARELELDGSETATSSDPEDDDDDDLDRIYIPRRKSLQSRSQTQSQSQSQSQKRHSRRLQSPSQQLLSETCGTNATETQTQRSQTPVRTVPHENGGERIVMTDDEDNSVLEKWRAKKQRANSEKVGSKRKTTRAKGTATKGTAGDKRRKVMKNGIVGKQPRKETLLRERRRRVYGDETSDEEINSQTPLPVYLKEKKRKIDDAKNRLEKGEHIEPSEDFRPPPNYDDIYFSDDARMESLKSRPDFGRRIKPCAPYEDIELPKSNGFIPCSIAQYLRPYQVQGVEFMHQKFVFQEGCILGDDMGLGKTIQVIAFLTAMFGKSGDERDGKRMRKMRRYAKDRWYPRVLVICPGTLMSNWQKELETWGWWHVEVYHGPNKDDALAAAQAGMLEIMITTYSTYRLKSDDINMVGWDCVIADECHTVKDRRADITRRMDEVNALCRIGLSGTVIQNTYDELWTILNWCRPGGLGTLAEWRRIISGPLMRGQTHEATWSQIGHGRKMARVLKDVLLPQMFLRRLKSLIADQLPKKSDRVVFCPLSDVQREAYENFLDSELVEFIRDSAEPCPCGSGLTRQKCCYQDYRGKSWNQVVFPSILDMQKLCNHTANWIPSKDESNEAREKKLELLQENLPDRWRELSQREQLLIYLDPTLCGKWTVLQKLLKFWYVSNDKVLIFSYSLRMLHILQALFKQSSYNVLYLDGSMSLPERTQAVDDFNSDPSKFVFLISTKAGGVGLNITGANKVVVFDPHWNPAYDLQAQDRAYRMGQTRDVEVFRLITAGTVEEIIYARQIYKQQQANIGYGASEERRYFKGVMGDAKNRGELFGIKNLFTLQDTTILRDIVNKANVAEAKAGVLVGGLDIDAAGDDADDWDASDDDGTDMLSQIVGDMMGEDTKKPKEKNPIAAILAEAGVPYTHENSEVIGTSKVEAQISRRAMKSTDDTCLGDQRAFEEHTVPTLRPPPNPNPNQHLIGGDDGGDGEGQEGYSGEGEWEGEEIRFRPPEDVRKRQFVQMADMFGFRGEDGKGARDFALVVEGWTQKQRTNALNRFYRMRREGKRDLAQLGERELASQEVLEVGVQTTEKAEVVVATAENTTGTEAGLGAEELGQAAEVGQDMTLEEKTENKKEKDEKNDDKPTAVTLATLSNSKSAETPDGAATEETASEEEEDVELATAKASAHIKTKLSSADVITVPDSTVVEIDDDDDEL